MQQIYHALIGIMLLADQGCTPAKPAVQDLAGPTVILKLDDLHSEGDLVHEGWQQTFHFLNEEKVTGTIGLVCNSLEEGGSDYYGWINERANEGHEIWHHGYCHCKPEVAGVERREFRGTSFDYQLEHLSKSLDLAREKLGLTLRSFGAPYNSTDSNTARALETLPDIKVWMFKETKAPTSKFLLDRISAVNIEYPVHVPDFERFQAGYAANRDARVLVIQGHPRSWVAEPERFAEFRRIVLFLKGEGARFTTPYAYYLAQGDEE